jgi:hypothetical protein
MQLDELSESVCDRQVSKHGTLAHPPLLVAPLVVAMTFGEDEDDGKRAVLGKGTGNPCWLGGLLLRPVLSAMAASADMITTGAKEKRAVEQVCELVAIENQYRIVWPCAIAKEEGNVHVGTVFVVLVLALLVPGAGGGPP